jgi:autotransporter-associated beta strand protein
MKPRFNYNQVSSSGRLLVGALVMMVLAQNTPAATLYWDTNGSSAGSGAATGTWGLSNFWNSDSTGFTNTYTPTTTSADNLFISAGTSGTAGTIVVDGAQSANSITFDDNVAITLTGTSINLGSTTGAGIFVASGDNAANTISTGLVLGAASTIQNAGTGVLTLNRKITGTGGLTLQNNNATAGGIVLSGPAVNNVGSITNSGTSTGSVTISAIIGSNVTGVTQNSAGSSLTLSGANRYSGDTKSSAGTLILSNNLALQNSALDTSGAGVVTLSGAATPTFGGLKGNNNLASVITTGYGSMSALTLNPGSGVSNTYGGIISNGSGATTLTLTGAYGPGTQVLTGANTYTGLTTISGGTLQIGDGITGSLNGSTGTGLTFNTYGGAFRVMEAAGSSQGMGALTFSAGANTVSSTYAGTVGTNVTTLTFSSLAARGAGATGNFEVSGIGITNGVDNKIVLTGVATGFIDRGLYFNGADYAAINSSGNYVQALAYGSDANAAAVDTITASNHVKLTATPSARVGDTLLSLNLAGSGVGYTMSSGSLSVPGILKSGGGAQGVISGGSSVTTAGNAELVIRTDTASDLLAINTAISGTSGGLTKTGAGTLTLGATNTYTGTTTVLAGTLAQSATGFIADTSALTINGPTAVFDLGNNKIDTVGAVTLSGGGSITGTGTSTLTASSYTLNAGTVGAILASGGVTKNTNGTVTLTGANTAIGALTVNAGSLVIAGPTARYNTTSGTSNINASANLTISGGGGFSHSSGASPNMNIGNNVTGANVLVTGPGSTFNTSGTLNLGTGNSAMDNSLTISNGATATTFIMLIAQGNNAAPLHNNVTITGNGSSLSVANVFEPFDGGQNGQISVLDGGSLNTMTVANMYIGYYANSKNNTILVDGTNSVWNAAKVTNWWGGGGAASGNALTISNGGRVNFTQAATAQNSANFINLNSNGVFSTLQLTLSSNTMVFNGGILEARSSNASFVTGGSISLLSLGTVNTNTFNSTISSPFSGAGSLTKTGAGTLTLSGTNTHTGGTVVNGGTLLAAAAANLSSTGSLTVNAGGAFSMQNNAAVTTYAATSLTLAGGANLTFDLVGTNTADKLTSTNAATTSGGNIGISINGVTTPVVNTPTNLITSTNGGLLTGTTRYFVSNNTNYTATLSESATAVNITGYTGGATALTNNAYWLGNQVTDALGSMNFSSGTTSNWASAAAGTSANGVVPGGSTVNAIFGSTGGAQQASVSADADMTLGNITFNDTAAVTIGGSHVITLNNTSATAATTTAALATITNAGSNTNSAISVTSFANATNTINANLALGAANTWNVAGTNTLAVGGSVYNGGFGLTIAGTGNVNISGAIIGTNGTGGLTQTTTGTVTLSGANTFSGTTAVNAGTLALSGSGTLGSSATASLAGLTLGGGKLDLGGTSQTVGAVSITTALGGGNNTIQNGSLTGTSYAASNTSGNAIVTANLLGNASGSAGLTVSGNGGTLTLTGANTYIGTTNVSTANATLQIGNNTATGSLSLSSAITLSNAAATLAINRSNAVVQGIDFATVISGTGIVSQIGSNSLTLNGANTYSGGTKVGSGTLTAGSATAFGTGTLTVNGGALDSSVASLTMTANNAQVWNTDFAFTGTNSLNLGTGTVSLGSTVGNRTVTANASTLTIGGIISNGTATGLTKAGGGTMILSGNNVYTGTTGINAGSLQANHASALGNGGNITFGGGTLQFSSVFNNATAAWGARIVSSGSAVTLDTNGQNVTVSGNIDSTNTGGLTKSGAGVLTLTGSNTYSGGTIVNAGILTGTGSSSLGATTGALAVNNQNTGAGTAVVLNLSTTAATTTGSLSGTIANSGSGINTATINNGGQLFTVNQIVDATFAGEISGTGGFTLGSLSTSKLTLTGTNTYSGNTTVNAGTLLVNGAITGGGSVSVGASGKIGGTGSISGNLSVSGILSPGASILSMTTSSLTMNAGSTFVFEAADVSSTGADLLAVDGTLSLTSVTLDLSGANLDAGTWLAGNKLTLISYKGTAITSGFTGYLDDQNYLFGSNSWTIDYNDSSKGNNFSSQATGLQFVTLTMVPEPSSILLGVVGLMLTCRRRR